MLPESRERGYKPGRFSFNVQGGRCEACQGEGQRRIEMNFLPDVYVLCDVCNGRRYNQETLAVRFNGYSIADLLDLPIADALPVLKDIPTAAAKLQTLVDVGLGYIHLGQSATTLSGGEAQRMKLARELSKRQTGRTLYLLDEPTTGLHFDDVRKLLEVLHRLTDLGNTVIIIEHNLDIVRNADYILDMGPEGGERGGRVVAHGTRSLALASAHPCRPRAVELHQHVLFPRWSSQGVLTSILLALMHAVHNRLHLARIDPALSRLAHPHCGPHPPALRSGLDAGTRQLQLRYLPEPLHRYGRLPSPRSPDPLMHMSRTCDMRINSMYGYHDSKPCNVSDRSSSAAQRKEAPGKVSSPGESFFQRDRQAFHSGLRVQFFERAAGGPVSRC